MQKIKIFLAGGSGFIGRHIREQLGGAYDIVAPTSTELDLTNAQAVLSFFTSHPVDVVVNAAAIGVKRDHGLSGVAMTNLTIFFNLIQAKSYFTRMIMLGSGAEYDKRRSLEKVSESEFGQFVPVDEYGFYKYVCAQYAWQVDYITHLRLFAVFGKYEDFTTRFISNAICKALLGLPITIKKNVRFDYFYINDFVRLLDNLITDPLPQKICNVGSGEVTDLYSIAQKILTITSANVPIQLAEAGMGKEYSPDLSDLKKNRPNVMVTSLEVAMAELVAYYRSILPELNRDQFLIDA